MFFGLCNEETYSDILLDDYSNSIKEFSALCDAIDVCQESNIILEFSVSDIIEKIKQAITSFVNWFTEKVLGFFRKISELIKSKVNSTSKNDDDGDSKEKKLYRINREIFDNLRNDYIEPAVEIVLDTSEYLKSPSIDGDPDKYIQNLDKITEKFKVIVGKNI